jgi:hypothetical protein
VDLGNEKVYVLKQMKILGLIFSSTLNWYNQTVTAIEKANKAKQALRIISKFFSSQEMVKLSTALFYSRLYYGAKVWLSSALSVTLKKASSKMLKICQKDWQGQFSYKTLHKISGKATPEMWSNYSAACGMYIVITTCVPEDTFVNLTENFLNSERSQGLQFTRSNRRDWIQLLVKSSTKDIFLSKKLFNAEFKCCFFFLFFFFLLFVSYIASLSLSVSIHKIFVRLKNRSFIFIRKGDERLA